jgi:anti-sigma factor (TIGR02949 family)
MNCRETSKLIHEYIDGEISSEDSSDLQEHLSGCSHCRRRVEFEKLLRDSIKPLLHIEIPPYLPERISLALQNEK